MRIVIKKANFALADQLNAKLEENLSKNREQVTVISEEITRIAGLPTKVLVLSNGQRVIAEEDMSKILDEQSR